MKHGCPRRQQSRNMAKSLSPTFWPYPTPRGMGFSVKCEEPIDELAVQVWLLYDHPNFKYCTLFVSGTELRTDKRTDGQTDDPITRCPRRTFQAGGIKVSFNSCIGQRIDKHVTPRLSLNCRGIKNGVFRAFTLWRHADFKNSCDRVFSFFLLKSYIDRRLLVTLKQCLLRICSTTALPIN